MKNLIFVNLARYASRSHIHMIVRVKKSDCFRYNWSNEKNTQKVVKRMVDMQKGSIPIFETASAVELLLASCHNLVSSVTAPRVSLMPRLPSFSVYSVCSVKLLISKSNRAAITINISKGTC